MTIQVTLIPENSCQEPLAMLYLLYRQTVTPRALPDLLDEIRAGTITAETILAFVRARADEGHVSPWHAINFCFAIGGISRSCSAQLLRHSVGVAVEERSLRVVDGARENIGVVKPPSVAGPVGSYETWEPDFQFHLATVQSKAGYRAMTGPPHEVPREDARYVLPLGIETALTMTASLSALLHMADLRLCTAAQWEIRGLFQAIRHELIRHHPEIGRLLAPKCAAGRQGFCDEPLKRYEACPLRFVRPHKTDMLAWAAGKGWRDVIDADLALAAAASA